MALIEGLREQPRDEKTVAFTILLLLLSGAYLRALCFSNLGDSILKQGFDAEVTANEDVRVALFVMVALRTVSQMVWTFYLSNYYLSFGMGFVIAFFNCFFDTIGILVSLWNKTKMEPIDYFFLVLYVFGIFLERLPEIQRTIWKAKPENKGKAHMGGAFAVAVHINYTGYFLWRLAFHGFTHFLPLLAFNLFFLNDFIKGDIRTQRERNIKKYGEDFKRYWDSTPKMFPGIY